VRRFSSLRLLAHLLAAWCGRSGFPAWLIELRGLAGEKITLLLDRGVGVLRFAGDDDRAN